MCDARCAHVAAPILYSCEVRAGHFVKRGQIGRFRPLFAYIHAGDRLADEAGQPFMNLLHLNKSTLYVHAPDSSIFISTYIAGRYATVFYDLRAASCGREVGVGLGNLQAGRSLARSLAMGEFALFSTLFYLFIFFSFFLFFLFFSIPPFFSLLSSLLSLPLSLALFPRPALLVSPVAAPLSTVHICF